MNFLEILDTYLKKIKIVRFLNYYKKKEFKIFKKFNLDEKSLFIDLGANKGDITQFVIDKYNCKTESYEPEKNCYLKLKKRFKDRKKNKVFSLGISKNSFKKKIYYHKKFKLNNYIYSQSSSFIKEKKNIDKNNFLIVKTIPIKKLLSKHKFIDLIKIDIEGYEYEILPEIINNRNKIKNVLCELHGSPDKKNKNGKTKNSNFLKKYNNIVSKLKKKKLYGNWFIEWI